jgi:integrase/recombinase XerD
MYSRNPPMLSTKELNFDLAFRFGRWLRVQHYGFETQRLYLASVMSLCQFLDEMPATEATHLDIRDFLALIAAKGHKPATIHREMYALRSFYDFLNMGGLINWSPPRFIRLRRVQRNVPRVLTEKQIDRLLSATQSSRIAVPLPAN